MEPPATHLVSIIIPCYNYAHFLAEAIESALAQSYASFEVIVIDDGSTDETRAVVARFPQIRYFHQVNSGLPAARNTGLRESKGDYVVFLDADDKLLPAALEAGVSALEDDADAAFVWGYTQLISSDGWPLPTELFLQYEDRDCYLWLLRRNYIWNPGAVMYRRAVFDAVGDFDTSLTSCEDYELYLRIARKHRIACHGRLVVEYRMHGDNMSRNSARMLDTVLAVMRSQNSHVARSERHSRAHREGIKFKRKLYGLRLMREIYRHVRRQQNLTHALRSFRTLVRYYPRGMFILMWRLPKKLHRVARRRR